MIVDTLKAIIFAGLPVALFSYYLIHLASKKTQLKSSNAKQLKKELKNAEFNEDENSGFLQQMLHKKSLKFGGGFYGIMALITYLHIEFYQVIDFIKKFKSFSDFIDSIGFRMLINFFIEAIMNLISAFLWFLYWFKYLPIGSFWIWLLVAILAHSIATRYALANVSKHN